MSEHIGANINVNTNKPIPGAHPFPTGIDQVIQTMKTYDSKDIITVTNIGESFRK